MTTLDPPPTAIGKYRLVASLGAGGMAQVYLAVVSGPGGFNKLLVLKLLRGELAQDAKFKLMFLDEARLAARLNHPNVVQTFEVGEEAGRTFLAMEYLEGQPLSAIVRKIGRERFPLACSVRLLADMLAGLHHAHELCDYDGKPLRVVHRDVSPPNVMVTYEGVVKLMDFGIAAAATASQVTETGTFKGKASYAAPEQISGSKVDRRADLFAVGVMLWEALACRRISEGKQDIHMMHQRVAGLDPSIDEVAPDAPEELRAVCTRAMHLDPAARYPTAREMQQALLAWLQRQAPVSLGDLVAEAFADEHARLRLLVEEAVRRSREDSAVTSLPQLTMGVLPTPSHGTQAPLAEATPAPPTPSTLPRPARGGSLLFPALAGLLLLSVGLVAAFRPRDGAQPSATATQAAPPAGSAAPPAATTADSSPPSDPPGGSASSPPGSAASAPTQPPAPPTRGAPAPRADKAPTHDPPPDPDRATPKSKKPKRAIDDGDPYAK